MKIEVGMYAYSIESRERGIGKIINIDENRTHLEVTIKTKNGRLTTRKEFTKASFDITDLIEVGDVIAIKEDIDRFGQVFILGIYVPTLLREIKEKISRSEIKLVQVLTKEQFEANAFKVGE